LIEFTFARHLADLDQQILTQGAANATVAHLDQLFIRPRQRRATVTDQRDVDIDLRHIVDDHRHAPAFAIVQDVIEQGCFPAPRKPDSTVYRKFVGDL